MRQQSRVGYHRSCQHGAPILDDIIDGTILLIILDICYIVVPVDNVPFYNDAYVKQLLLSNVSTMIPLVYRR